MDKKKINTREDIIQLVDSFYGKVQDDELLGPIFNSVIDEWPVHLEKMYRFWGTVLLYERSYRGSPFMPHSVLPIEKKHFDQWLNLFHQTLDEEFTGKIAEEAKWRSVKMAEMFQIKLGAIRENPERKALL